MVSSEDMAWIIRGKMVEMRVKSQAQMAKRIGISAQLFSSYLTGKVAIPLPTLSRICSYLNMSQEERGAFLM